MLGRREAERFERALIEGAERLRVDERFLGKLEFNSGELEFFINDRALCPNTAETFKAAEPELQEAELFAHVHVSRGRVGLAGQRAHEARSGEPTGSTKVRALVRRSSIRRFASGVAAAWRS